MRRSLYPFLVALALSSGAFVYAQQQPAAPQAQSKIDPEVAKDRRYAVELYTSHKSIEALPWLEKVAVALPGDAVVQEMLGICRMDLAETLPTLEERKAKRIQARQALLRAKELGDTNDILVILLQLIPEDGADRKFSDNAEIDRLLKAGEAAFSARKLEEAKENYLRVIAIDPNHSTAMLYLGDVYFIQKQYGAAVEWFSRSAKANPNSEAAYRYWADALISLGRYSEAREKYILSVVSDPYTQASWSGFKKWSKFVEKDLTWYKFQPGSKVEDGEPGKDGKGQINITIESLSGDKDDGSGAWIIYAMEKALWRGEKFKKEFPNEPKYRHTLKEEASALSLVAHVAVESGGKKKKKQKLSPDIEALLKLEKNGFIEPYVLFNAADEGIAQDYIAYREKHRDVLIRYLSDIVLPAAPPDKPLTE
jgi:tetratricopeptide (TPR) repeat protein